MTINMSTNEQLAVHPILYESNFSKFLPVKITFYEE